MNKKTLVIITFIIGTPLLVGILGYYSSDTATEPSSSSSGFFPIGLYAVNSFSPYSNDITKEFPEIATAGFNVIQSYQFEGDLDGPANAIEDARAYLDAAHKSGLKVLMGIPQECVVKRNLACIRKRVSALKEHPALFGWQLYDEPDVPGYDLQGKEQAPSLPPENLIAAYKAIKELDPTHPVSIASFLEIDEKYPYLNGFDIFLGDYMNIPVESPAANIAPYVPSAVRVLTPLGKYVMPTVQVYNLAKDALITSGGANESGQQIMAEGRYPTREEIRFMTYYSIILGAKGVFLNCYRFDYGKEVPGDDISRKANPKQWQAVSSVATELKSLSPVLSTPTVEPAGITVTGGHTAIMLKKYQDRYYLFITNPSPSTNEFEVKFDPDKFLTPKILLYPEKWNIPSPGNSFTDKWGPYDVRIYMISTGESINPLIPQLDFTTKVGPQEDVLKPYSYGLTDFPDGLFGVLKKDGTYYWFIGSFPPGYKWGEDTPRTYLFRFIGNSLENMKLEPMDKKGNAIPVGEPGPQGSFDDHIFGNGSAYYDENTGKLYFWYQAMKNLPESAAEAKGQALGDNFYDAYDSAYGSIGLAVSEDMGMTFEKKGAVLKIHLTEEKFTNDPGVPYADAMPPAIIRYGDYLYMYYNDYSNDDYKQDQIAVARLHLSDLDKSPQPWKKWFQGHFQGEALGGAFTPLFGDAAFPSVSYNTCLKKWIMVHISAEPNIFYYRTSADGLRWSSAQLLVKSDHERNWLMHPTLIGFGEDPSITGREFWLYYAYAPNKRAEPGGWLVRRKIILGEK